jgi:hypothetical protein
MRGIRSRSASAVAALGAVVVSAGIGLTAGAAGAGAPAVGPHPQPAATVRPVAAAWTPRVLDARANVRQLVTCGATMYAVGHFHTIGHGGHRYIRRNAFSFDATTGAVTSWNPNVHGLVDSIALGPRCGVAYLGGRFTGVGTTKVHDLAAVSTRTGTVRPAFGHTTNGEVETLRMVRRGAQLLVGGAFTAVNGTDRAYLASLDPATGAVTGYLRPHVTGRLPGSSGRSMVYNEQVSRDGRRLLVEGDFNRVGGQLRHQIAELDLGTRHATLDPWRNYRLNHSQCSSDMIFYGRAAAFAPNGRTIYLAGTGFEGTSPFCDAVTAFTNTAPARVTWINKTGGDSLYAVAASRQDVYIGGHERWADNPKGLNSCGPGCVPRRGIGSISPSSGRALPWNPTRSRGRGADDLLLTRAGLWVASDTFYHSTHCAGASHPGICFFPRHE